MKKTVLNIITVLVFCFGATAQNVNIPDANFKAYLVGNSTINTNSDSEIQVSEANAFNGAINCSNQGINDLTGIEEFTALTKLIFFGNNVNSLDVSQNTALTELSFNHNNISVLDLSQNTALTLLICSNNDISVLDVSQNTALTILNCSSNYISVLDVSQHTALIGLDCDHNNIGVLDVSQSTGLTHLKCQFNNLMNLDVSQNTNLSQFNCDNNNIGNLDLSQNTAIAYLRCQNNNLTVLNLKNLNLSSLTTFTALGNPNLTCIEVDDVAVASAALVSIDPASSFSTYCEPIVNIPDANFKAYLVGNNSINTNMDTEIQMSEANAFAGTINCSNQDIVDMTGIEAFTSLTELNCRRNDIITLDLSQNTTLQKLNCDQNDLTTLDLSQNTVLFEVRCRTNNLNSLNLSQNAALTFLICDGNNLTTLDFHPNTNLGYLSCGSNNLSVLDLTQHTALTGLYCLNNNLTTIDLSQNTALTGMRIESNNLSTLDLSQNTQLTSVLCSENNLTTLDVSQNIALTELECSWNDIVSLDVSQNTNLTSLSCGSNNLMALNLKNISPSTLIGFWAYGSPNLSCIEVDDVAAANAAWTNIDAASSFSTNCSPIVNIPDANFKAYLVGNSLINTNSDSEIQVSEANAFTGAILCYGDNISDLTGIEEFTALTELNCDENNLTTIDVSQNTALIKLSCSENDLTNLDVSQNTALEILWCTDSYLTALDVSQNTNLTSLDIEENNLTALDISLNTSLVNLSCGRSNLTTLDVSQNLALLYLWCKGNNLTALDLSPNVNLEALDCRDNNLMELNMKNISISTLSPFRAQNNPNLTCIEVDDVAAATAAWTNIDAQTSFSENCNVVTVTFITVQGEAGASTISTLGGTLQMVASVVPANATDATYTWSIANGTGSATITPDGLITAMTDGIVTVMASANDGSGVVGSAVITISNQSSSTEEQRLLSNISIYPNPANAQMVIDAKRPIEVISILDIMGKTVKRIVDPYSTIDVSDLAKGIYFLQMKIDETLVSKKIIKE